VAARTGDCVLGIDVGGTKMASAAVDRAGNILLRMDVASPSDDGEMMVSTLVDLARHTIAACSEKNLGVAAVGLGAAGFVLAAQGLMISSPNIAWADVPLKMVLTDGTGLPSFIDNDGNAAALGERFAGVCRGVDDFVYITLGTGIGGGVFSGAKLLRGHRGTAGELGHMIVEPDGPLCACGGRGCLEVMASGTALEREAARLMAARPESALNGLCGGNPERLTGEMVSEAAEAGDAAALEAFARVAYYLGLGIVSLIHIFDPRMVVIGGGVSHSGHLLLDEVNRVVAERGIPALVESTSIVVSTLGTEAGILGAAALAWEGIGRLP
jgi:glucokinase